MDLLRGVTPTRVRGALECYRRWALVELFGAESPDNYYSAWGTAMHKVIEDWYTDGIEPPDTEQGRAVAAGMHLMPDRGPHLKVEQERVFDQVPGTIDLHYVEGDTVHIFDWKSIGASRNKKGRKALLADSQPVIYALAALEHYGLTKCELHWVYFEREAPYDPARVDVEVDYQTLHDIYVDKFRGIVLDMISKQTGSKPEDFSRAASKNACWAIRNGPGAPAQRCHQEAICLAVERRQSMGTLADSDLFRSFMSDEKAVEATDINPPDVPVDVPEEPKSKKKVKGFVYYRNCRPINGPTVTEIGELLDPAMRLVESTCNAPYWSAVEYGKGKAHLASIIREQIESGAFAGKTIVACGYSDEITAVDHEFLRGAKSVVVGV